MPEIRFYHLERSPLEQVIYGLLSKILERDMRAVIRVSNKEQVEILAGNLWRLHPDGFLPHGTKKDGYGEDQPVWITDKEGDIPNDAKVLVLSLGAELGEFPEDIDIICLVFDGNDVEAVQKARKDWKLWRDDDRAELSYWQQTARGGWDKKA